MSFLKRLFGKKGKRYFLIASHGQTATLWLASAINRYPGVFCSHAYNYPPEGAQGRNLTGEENQIRIEMSANRFWTLDLNDFLSEIDNVTDHSIVGNVHAYTYGRVRQLLPTLTRAQRSNFMAFNMVRHPVTRVMSMFRCWYNEETDQVAEFVNIDFKNRSDHIKNYILGRHKVEFSTRDKAFIVSLLAMEDITKDAALASKDNIENISFEKVTADQDYFIKLMRAIVGAEHFDSDVAASIFFETPLINKHNKSARLSIEEECGALQDWQRDALKFISDNSKMNDVYSGFGYDLAF
jgi:hypothetical protein